MDRTGAAINKRFVRRTIPRAATVASANSVNVAGAVYEAIGDLGDIGDPISVVNVGRPAAAIYAPANTPGGAVYGTRRGSTPPPPTVTAAAPSTSTITLIGTPTVGDVLQFNGSVWRNYPWIKLRAGTLEDVVTATWTNFLAVANEAGTAAISVASGGTVYTLTANWNAGTTSYLAAKQGDTATLDMRINGGFIQVMQSTGGTVDMDARSIVFNFNVH